MWYSVGVVWCVRVNVVRECVVFSLLTCALGCIWSEKGLHGPLVGEYCTKNHINSQCNFVPLGFSETLSLPLDSEVLSDLLRTPVATLRLVQNKIEVESVSDIEFQPTIHRLRY